MISYRSSRCNKLGVKMGVCGVPNANERSIRRLWGGMKILIKKFELRVIAFLCSYYFSVSC